MVLRGKNWLNYSSLEIARFQTYFIAVIFFLCVFSQFTAYANFIGQPCSINENLGFYAHDEQPKTFFQPFHDPSQTDTGIPIAEFLSETEVQEEPFPDKDASLHAGLSFYKIDSLDSSKNLQQQFSRSVQNRPTLSLIILHHSWKSFLI
jgi:hypothetical protein